MKLNYDCVRAILMTLENHLEYNDLKRVKPIQFEDMRKFPEMIAFSENDVQYASEKLNEGGYIEFDQHTGSGGFTKMQYRGITFAGTQFIEYLKSDSNWNESKKKAEKIGVFALDVLETVSRGVAEGYTRAILSDK